MVLLFDVDKTHLHRLQAVTQIDKYGFLAQAIELEIAHRVVTFEKTIHRALINGARTHHFDQLNNVQKIDHINDYRCIKANLSHQNERYTHLSNIAQNFDLIIDSLKIHTISDIKRYFSIIKNHLEPGGIFIAAFYGGESLRELRQSLLHAELEIYDGAALRIIPMIDIQTTVQLLNFIGFKNCIVDREIFTITYPNLYAILKDIKGMGESDPFTSSPPAMTYQHFKKAEQFYKSIYNQNGEKNLKTTVEIIYIKCELADSK